MILEGYVKLFRSINTWQWYDDPNTKSLFLHFIINANYKTGYFKGIEIKRGQIFVGRKELAKELGMSEQSIRTSMNRLKSTNEITTQTTNSGTLVTVINYEKYQVDYDFSTNETTSELTNEQPTTNQRLTNEQPQRKKDNKDNKDNKAINKEIYSEIIDYLNSKVGSNYKANNKETQRHINARLSDGYTVEDFKKVIDKKCKQWIGTEQEQYLRPSTLFGSKFEGYLNQKEFNKQEDKPSSGWDFSMFEAGGKKND